MNKRKFSIYTDGSYDMSDRVGASACVILNKDESEILFVHATARKCDYNPEKKQRTNEQEIGAIIRAIMSVPNGSEILIHSDSQYAVKVLSGENNAYTNLDLIERYRKEVNERNHRVSFKWVRGHDGNRYNEMADALCTKAANDLRKDGGKLKTRESINKCFEL